MKGSENSLLRPFREGDAEAIARYASNRKIWANLRDRFPHPYSLEDAQAFLRMQNEHPGLPVNLAITQNDELIGIIGIIPQEDIYRFSAEIGYWLAEPYWGQGILTRALKEMSGYAFANFDIIRLFAGVFEHNAASMRVLEKAGFVKEAVIRKKVWKDEQLLDEHLYVLFK